MAKNKTVILKYPGSKWRIADWIISHFPPHKVYVEPFFGSGAVFFHKKPSTIEIVNDIDSNIVNFFQVIRDSGEEFAKAIFLTPYARDELQKSYGSSAKKNNLEKARMFAVKGFMSYGASHVSKNGFRCGISPLSPEVTKLFNNVPAALLNASARLKMAQIENKNALDLIKKCNYEDILIYLDPPYLPSTRKKLKLYKNEMTFEDHEELLKTVIASKSQIVISGYDSELYNHYLSGWNKFTKKSAAEHSTPCVEVLWVKPTNIQLNLFDKENRNNV